MGNSTIQRKKNNFFQNFIYSIKVQIILLMTMIGGVLYVLVREQSRVTELNQIVITRQLCMNEIKIIISDLYLESVGILRDEEIKDLEYRMELILEKEEIYQFVSGSVNEQGRLAAIELDTLFDLALEAQSNRYNSRRLSEILHDSLKHPDRASYDYSSDGIINSISSRTKNNRMFIISLFIVLILTYMLLNRIAVRIGDVTNTAKRLLNDDNTLQLTERMEFNAHNETIYIRDNMNIFLKTMEDGTVQLLNNARGLVYQITQMFASAKGWTLETQVMRHSTERISRQMGEQILSVNQSSATLEEMERTLDIIFNNISRQSAAMTEAATTLEEMGRQVDGVAKIASDTAHLATQLTEVANKGNEAVDASVVSIRDVAEYSSQILKLLQLISGIAKQTNLLAMNASIEAAHAGEAGRGFAIVAEEIRRLSETTNKNAKEIRTVVDTMVEKIDNSVEQARIAGEDLQQINTYSENVAERIAQLNNMMQQQNIATHEMITTIEGLVNLAQEIKISMEEQQQGLHDYSNTIKDLRENFGEVKSTLDGHMASVSSLLVILTDMGIRIGIQKQIMDAVGLSMQIYKVDENRLIDDAHIQISQEQLFLEEKNKLLNSKSEENL